MTLPSLQLSEPVVKQVVALLEANLATTIAALNQTVTDGFEVPAPAQILDYVPVPSTLQGGTPAIGVQRLPATFVDDLVTSMDAIHQFAVVAILSHVDHRTLVWQLDRMAQAIGNVVQADRRQLPAGGILQQAGLWNVKFLRTEPGPMLGDLDPINPEAPPQTYLSWTLMLFEARRTEV